MWSFYLLCRSVLFYWHDLTLFLQTSNKTYFSFCNYLFYLCLFLRILCYCSFECCICQIFYILNILLAQEKGCCPLHVAARAGQASQVELLIVYGADPGATDSQDNTPAHYARSDFSYTVPVWTCMSHITLFHTTFLDFLFFRVNIHFFIYEGCLRETEWNGMERR